MHTIYTFNINNGKIITLIIKYSKEKMKGAVEKLGATYMYISTI